MSLDKTCVLAIDLGTSACKTALITASGRVLGWESEPLLLAIGLIVVSAGLITQLRDPQYQTASVEATAQQKPASQAG